MVPASDAFLAYVDYTSSPIATGFLGLYTTDYKQLYFEEFDTFNKIKIGLLKNSYIEKILSDFRLQIILHTSLFITILWTIC